MDDDAAVEALQALVRLPTVSSHDPERAPHLALAQLHEELERRFPLLHTELSKTTVHDHGLLFHWRGASDARPVVLMAHQDVVPAEGQWARNPFGADLVDGHVHGRGTLDDKGSLVAICTAVERLLAAGTRPAQDVWLSFGGDEEVGGRSARAAVDTLQGKGIRPWLVLDEGGAVAHQAFPGVETPMAVIGVTEKGQASLELTAYSRGGHAATPDRNGPTVRLARAILKLDNDPLPASAPTPTVELVRRMAPYAPIGLRHVLANAARVPSLLTRLLVATGAETAAMTRTTIATTTLSGSAAPNVIASRATAGLNVRIMVGDTVAGVLDHVRRTIGDDSIHVEVLDASEPSPVSPFEDEAFRLLEDTIRETHPDAVPAPYVLMAATDSRHFTAICERIYRFTPFRMTKEQRESIHAADEHLGVGDFLDGIRWYTRFLERLPAG